jgi:HPt (histidine-containing phosphotransfer) domain-containing protein
MYAQFDVQLEGLRPSFERPLDLVHLTRQTLGDRDLEREILELFVRQVRAVLLQLQTAETIKLREDIAHTLKGSARAVGAWSVALKAEACEQAGSLDPGAWIEALDGLTASVREVCLAIEDLQQENHG